MRNLMTRLILAGVMCLAVAGCGNSGQSAGNPAETPPSTATATQSIQSNSSLPPAAKADALQQMQVSQKAQQAMAQSSSSAQPAPK